MCYKNDIAKDNYWGSSKYLKEDYKIYGKQNFTKEILNINYKNKEELLDGETEYILKFNTLAPNGYNHFLPNTNPGFHMAGISNHHTLSAKIKIGNAFRGKKLSAEHKRKISESNKGKIRSIETRKKYSEAKKGKKLSAEHKRKISESEKGRIFSVEEKQKLKDVWLETHPNNNKKPTNETIKKLSEASKNIQRVKCYHCNKLFTPWGIKHHEKKLSKLWGIIT